MYFVYYVNVGTDIIKPTCSYNELWFCRIKNDLYKFKVKIVFKRWVMTWKWLTDTDVVGHLT